MTRIKELRVKKGVTALEVSKAISVSSTQLGKYEKGLAEPRQDVRQELANYFGVSVPYLMGYDATNFTDEEIKEGIVSIFEALGADKDDDEMFEMYKRELADQESIMANFFTSFFEKTEGRAYSRDKGNFTTGRVIRALSTKKHLPLRELYDIEKYPQMKEYEGEIAYWCPNNLKNTEEAIELFWNVINFDFERILKYLQPEKIDEELS